MTKGEASIELWFCAEVLPLEGQLMRFITRHWRETKDAADVRQDVYERVLNGARRQLPRQTAPYVFKVARNVVIDRVRRAKIVKFELMAEMDDLALGADWLTPERYTDARQQLSRVIDGIQQLPKRCRQVMMLRKMEGLSTRQVAERMGIGIDAVEKQTTLGMRALTDYILNCERPVQQSLAETPDPILKARHDD